MRTDPINPPPRAFVFRAHVDSFAAGWSRTHGAHGPIGMGDGDDPAG